MEEGPASLEMDDPHGADEIHEVIYPYRRRWKLTLMQLDPEPLEARPDPATAPEDAELAMVEEALPTAADQLTILDEFPDSLMKLPREYRPDK